MFSIKAMKAMNKAVVLAMGREVKMLKERHSNGTLGDMPLGSTIATCRGVAYSTLENLWYDVLSSSDRELLTKKRVCFNVFDWHHLYNNEQTNFGEDIYNEWLAEQGD